MFVFSFSSKHPCSARKQLILLFESRIEMEGIPLQTLRDIPYEAQVHWSAEGSVETTHEYTHVLTQCCANNTTSLLCPVPSFLVGSQNRTRQKLAKVRIQGGTNKFKDLVGGESMKDKELGGNPHKTPNQPLASKQQDSPSLVTIAAFVNI